MNISDRMMIDAIGGQAEYVHRNIFCPPVTLSNQENALELSYTAQHLGKFHEIFFENNSVTHTLVIEYSIDMPAYF